jgi:hypothetical protein
MRILRRRPCPRQFHVSMLNQARKRGMYSHYVTALEMANIIRAAEDGGSRNPACVSGLLAAAAGSRRSTGN